MASDDASLSFKRITATSESREEQFFVVCRLHENNNDFEASTLDLTVVCGQDCWAGKGSRTLAVQFKIAPKHDEPSVSAELAQVSKGLVQDTRRRSGELFRRFLHRRAVRAPNTKSA